MHASIHPSLLPSTPPSIHESEPLLKDYTVKAGTIKSAKLMGVTSLICPRNSKATNMLRGWVIRKIPRGRQRPSS
jgi:hypothetical protein